MDVHPQVRQASADEVRDLLNLAIADDVQKIGLDAILNGCRFFILDGDKAQFAFALMPVGQELWIQAAGGTGERDLTALGFAEIEARAKAGNFESVGYQTRRAGLVRKAKKHGYEIDGYIMRKKIK